MQDVDLMNEARVEHGAGKELNAQIQAMQSNDPMFAHGVSVLGEYINHHVEEEQTELFPKVEKSKIDLEELGAEMASRKEELTEE